MSNFLLLHLVVIVLHSVEGLSHLGSPCDDDTDCNSIVVTPPVTIGEQAVCFRGKCQCPPYHLSVNATTCLRGSLLGFKCSSDAQCRVRVAMSGCVQGVCQCSQGYTEYRRSNCLTGSALGAMCRTQGQCRHHSPNSFCNFTIPRVMGRCECGPEYEERDGRCSNRKLGLGSSCSSNKECRSRIRGSTCQVFTDGDSESNLLQSHRHLEDGPLSPKVNRRGVCICPKGSVFQKNKCSAKARDVSEVAVSLGLKCKRTSECEAFDRYSYCGSEGVCECLKPTYKCSARNNGCHRDTFQCVSSGGCISSHFVCDGVTHCPDSSDEAYCQGRCSPLTHRCGDGRCITRSKVCDGREDCKDGSDEAKCRGDCPNSTFRCSDGTCLPGFEFCNASPSCSDGSDENHEACILGYPRLDYCPFRCYNGRCRSDAVVCSGRDGCGDNSDEEKCRVCDCAKPNPPN